MPRTNRSCEKVRKLFETLVEESGSNRLQMPVDEIATRTGLSVTTIYRAINELERQGALRTLPVESRQEPSLILWLGHGEDGGPTEEECLRQEFENSLRQLELGAARVISVFGRLAGERDEARTRCMVYEAELATVREKAQLLDKAMSLAAATGKTE